MSKYRAELVEGEEDQQDEEEQQDFDEYMDNQDVSPEQLAGEQLQDKYDMYMNEY